MADLTRLIGPTPHGLATIDWDSVEKRLGTALPADYRAFADAHPALEIDDYLWIYRPDAPSSAVDLLLGGLARARTITGLWRRYPDVERYPGYPEPGGLLCWGHHTGSGTCHWLTEGDPNSWPIVIGDKSDYWIYRGNFTSFLTGVLQGTVVCPLLADDFPEFVGGPLSIRWAH